MIVRILSVFALLSGALTGLVAAHSTAMDPVTCAGGEDYTGADQQTYAVVANNPATMLYVVFTQADATSPTKTPGQYNDADKVHPISIWRETNSRADLQTTARECKYADGHVWGVDGPGTEFDPQPNATERAAHPEYARRLADERILPQP